MARAFDGYVTSFDERLIAFVSRRAIHALPLRLRLRNACAEIWVSGDSGLQCFQGDQQHLVEAFQRIRRRPFAGG